MQEFHLCASRWPSNETKLPKYYPNNLYTIGINYYTHSYEQYKTIIRTMTNNFVRATDMQARTCVQFTQKWSQNLVYNKYRLLLYKNGKSPGTFLTVEIYTYLDKQCPVPHFQNFQPSLPAGSEQYHFTISPCVCECIHILRGKDLAIDQSTITVNGLRDLQPL